ncbi:MAG TPA: hypothetical protein VLX12_00515 [Syntrophorhabdales bacterium]|nr:hypothetical protein [Syntrophorhabdales bacterium]
MRRKTKWISGAICIVAITAVILSFSFRRTILLEAGTFMAPTANHVEGVADVVILEGAEFVSRGMVSEGVELLSSDKAKRLVIVLHRVAQNHSPFPFNEDYSSSVRTGLQSLGLKPSSFTVIATPIREPITLTSARGALQVLSRDGVKSAILVSSGFHMRRSFLVYQHLSAPLAIKIFPLACFDQYRLDNWWNEDIGVRDFVEEASKLVLYVVASYIPLKLF